MKKLSLISFLLLLTAVTIYAQQTDFLKLTGPYLGQKPPGRTPEIFAPGIVSTEGLQLRLFSTPDGSEIIYMSMINIPGQGDKPVNMHFRFINIKMKNNIWQQPEIIPFSKEYRNDEPSLSYDGNKLFFVSNRPPVDKTEPPKIPDIWMVERRGEGWGYPINIGPPVNSEGVEVQPFYSRDSKLYFRRRDGLYYSEFKDGRYLSPVKLDEKKLKPNLSFICISPDNKILIGHSFNPDSHGSSDLYASFYDKNGNWGSPFSLGNEINTDQNESYATFSSDGKYIFFTRGNDIYWVSAKIIEELRPKE